MKITDLNAIHPGLITRSVSQISKTLKVLGEQLPLAECKYSPPVAWWLRQRDAALLAPIKDATSFERCS
jgi:hypothetical protein